jgi:gas vesicle protein
MYTSKTNVLLALLSGTAIGTAIGVLYAPDSGTHTREKIKSKTLETTHDLAKKLRQTKEDISAVAQEKKVEFEEKIDFAITKASRKADDIIVSLEEKLEVLRKQNAKLQKSS